MASSAVDSIGPAVQHTKEQLFQPFRLGQWTRLAFVGLLAGELTSGKGCNFNAPGHGGQHHPHVAGFPHFDPALVIPLVAVAAVVIPVLWLLFLYVSSRMRFVLFDSVVAKHCSMARMWEERRAQAFNYFVWQVVFSLVALGGFAIFLGVPALLGLLLGWFREPLQHIAPFAIAAALVLAWILLIVTVHVFTKDFVVPQMALENISAFQGWSRLVSMVEREADRYLGYAALKVVMAIAGGIAVGILGFIVFLLILIPVGGLGLFWALVGHAAGLGWNAFTITIAVVAACALLVMVLYVVALISVPLIVFFPAYSIYFFAGRYPLLASIVETPSARQVLSVRS